MLITDQQPPLQNHGIGSRTNQPTPISDTPTRFHTHNRLTLEGMPLFSSRLALFLLACNLLPAAATTDEVIRRVETRYNGARTPSLNFVENYNIEGHPRPP